MERHNEILDEIYNSMGIPQNIVATASTVTGVPITPELVAELTFLSLFYIMCRNMKNIDLDSIKEDDLNKEIADVVLENEKLEKKLNFLYAKRELIKDELQRIRGITKDKYATELRNIENEIKIMEGKYEENLDKIDFMNDLRLLISHKKYLKEKGIWSKFEELSKKAQKTMEKLDLSVLKHEKVREFLSSVDVEVDLITK
ncbi:hypothetical protein [Sulfuracidifex metallicus]|uniref:Chromosome segregation protein SMC n=3 Tax=Sulfuracidifex metallicus TaxID=47303 RepID=A0A6A9QIA2_SULME|nr:hypothetical protein [Sulfuracidifex metallicus]MUN29007.1 hypothetical protein [Sulfuracidifex metallicus DSM 6482 = JCM 9184]WOE50483.1 hypothetical protein RQ359_002015 [Sulfuracidifex metallicus DSM 6482 = JCM 9184]